MKRFTTKQLIGVILTGLMLCMVSLAWSKWTLLTSIKEHYGVTYDSLTPNKIYSGNMDDEAVGFIVAKLRHALEQVRPQSPLTVLGQCQVTNLAATAPLSNTEHWRQLLFFRLSLDDPYHHLSYSGALDCSIRWSTLAGSQFLLAVILFVVLQYIPAPVCQRLAARITYWQRLGLTREEAREVAVANEQVRDIIETLIGYPPLAGFAHSQWLVLVKRFQLNHLTQRELAWLGLLFTRFKDEEQAFHNAFRLPEQLCFDAANQLLTIKGIEIKLTATPYYYYLWYAQKRMQCEDGWVLNPITTKADHELAAELIDLMEQYGGHGKAINDLARNGLTAKKLDQNRNKIKDEMIAALGEELASPFLFEGQREQTSLRYLYRIQAPKEKFKII